MPNSNDIIYQPAQKTKLTQFFSRTSGAKSKPVLAVSSESLHWQGMESSETTYHVVRTKAVSALLSGTKISLMMIMTDTLHCNHLSTCGSVEYGTRPTICKCCYLTSKVGDQYLHSGDAKNRPSYDLQMYSRKVSGGIYFDNTNTLLRWDFYGFARPGQTRPVSIQAVH